MERTTITITLAPTGVEPNDGYSYDTARLVDHYAARVTAAAEAAYPDACITVSALPRTLRTRITVDSGSWNRDEAIEQHLSDLLTQCWDDIAWEDFVADSA